MTSYAEDSSRGRACFLSAMFARRFGSSNLGKSVGDQRVLATVVARDVLALQGLAASALRAAVTACNIGTDDAGQARRGRAHDRRGAAAAEIADRYGYRVEVGGDPRSGAALRLFDLQDAEAGDGWGGGFAVY